MKPLGSIQHRFTVVVKCIHVGTSRPMPPGGRLVGKKDPCSIFKFEQFGIVALHSIPFYDSA